MDTLRVARVRAGVSVKVAAERIGVDETTIWRWEVGRSDIPAWAFMVLAELYDADPWQVDLSPKRIPPSPAEDAP